MRYHPTTRRPAFTLVELMVAAALTILIMTVLATAFSAAMESLSTLKSMGGLAERLRTTHNLLNDDLTAQHFLGGTSSDVPQVSDLRYDLLSPGGNQQAPPPGGFFFLRQGTGSVFEGLDQDQLFSTRGTDHVLGMTVRRQGKRPDQLFTVDLTPLINHANDTTKPPAERSAAGFVVLKLNGQSKNDVPMPVATMANPANLSALITVPSVFVSEWAEVYWFLGNPNNIGGVNNYTLYRRARVLTPLPNDNIPVAVAALVQDTISFRPVGVGTVGTNTPETIRVPTNRLFSTPDGPYTPNVALPGDDIVLTNVVGFELKATWQQASQWQTPGSGGPNTYAKTPTTRTILPNTISAGSVGNQIDFTTPFTNGAVANGDFPFDDLPVWNLGLPNPNLPENTSPAYTGKRVFDTWAPVSGWNTPGNPNCIPFRARIMGVQVKVRVFDIKNKLTRQSTLVVKL
jgi:type II secretory pathway component PulJ